MTSAAQRTALSAHARVAHARTTGASTGMRGPAASLLLASLLGPASALGRGPAAAAPAPSRQTGCAGSRTEGCAIELFHFRAPSSL